MTGRRVVGQEGSAADAVGAIWPAVMIQSDNDSKHSNRYNRSASGSALE